MPTLVGMASLGFGQVISQVALPFTANGEKQALANKFLYAVGPLSPAANFLAA